MKKLLAAALCLMLALTGAALAASGDYIGTWYLETMTIEGEVLNIQEYGMVCPLEISADGTAVLEMDGELLPMTWVEENGSVYAVDPDTGEKLDMSITDGVLTMEIMDSGMTFTSEEPEGLGEAPAIVDPVSYGAFEGVWELDYVIMDGMKISAEEMGEVLYVVIEEDCYLVGDNTGFSDALPCTLEGCELQMPTHGWVGTFREDTSLCLADYESEMWFSWVCYFDDFEMPVDDAAAIGSNIVYIEDLYYTIPTFMNGQAPAEYLGTWYMTSMREGEDVMNVQEYGMIVPLYMMSDGTAALVMDEPEFFHWGDDRGRAYIPDPYGEDEDMILSYDAETASLGMELYDEDGNVVMGMYFTQDAPEGAEALTMPVFPDYVYRGEGAEVPTVSADIPPVIDTATMVDYLGLWELVTYSDSDGSFSVDELGMEMTFCIFEDGTFTADLFGDIVLGSCYMDGCGLVLEELEGTAYFCVDGYMYIAEDGVVMQFGWLGYPDEEEAQPADSSAGLASAGGFTDVKYVATECLASGVSMDASVLGGEYSVIFLPNNNVTMQMGPTSLPGCTWTLLDDGVIHVDYLGVLSYDFVPTDDGFTMALNEAMVLTYTAE